MKDACKDIAIYATNFFVFVVIWNLFLIPVIGWNCRVLFLEVLHVQKIFYYSTHLFED